EPLFGEQFMLRFISSLLVIALVVLVVVAFVRGWVGVSWFSKEDANEAGATVTINKTKVREDVDAVKDKVHVSTEGSPARSEQVDGTVATVGDKEITLKTGDDKYFRLTVADETKVRIGD